MCKLSISWYRRKILKLFPYWLLYGDIELHVGIVKLQAFPIICYILKFSFMNDHVSITGKMVYTQNPSFSGYTQHWVLYTWDELIMSISQVGKPLHEFEEELSRSYLISTLNLLKPNLDSTFPEYGWGVWHTHVFQENVSIACEYLSYSDPTQMLSKWLIINANLCMIPKVE